MLLSAGRAVFGGQSSAMVLGRYLLARGALSAEQLESAFSLSDATVLASLGPIDILDRLASLVDTGELDANELQLAIADACVSTVLDLLTLPERDDRGDAVAMVFSEHDVTVTTDRFSLPLDEVVAEAELQLVALEAAQQKLGGLDARLRRMRRISKSDAPATLDAQEWAALAEMDDRATIAQLAHRLGLGTGRTYELLERLLDRGLIEPA